MLLFSVSTTERETIEPTNVRAYDYECSHVVTLPNIERWKKTHYQ